MTEDIGVLQYHDPFQKKLVKAAQETERIGPEKAPISQMFDIRTSTIQAKKKTCTGLWDRAGLHLVSHYPASEEL